jgi:hypothetical protein
MRTGVSFLAEAEDFYLFRNVHKDVARTQPSIERVPGLRWPECKVDHSSITCAKLKNKWSNTSSPPYAFMDKFTFCPVTHYLSCRIDHVAIRNVLYLRIARVRPSYQTARLHIPEDWRLNMYLICFIEHYYRVICTESGRERVTGCYY